LRDHMPVFVLIHLYLFPNLPPHSLNSNTDDGLCVSLVFPVPCLVKRNIVHGPLGDSELAQREDGRSSGEAYRESRYVIPIKAELAQNVHEKDGVNLIRSPQGNDLIARPQASASLFKNPSPNIPR
jgi:hypothetical protein